MIYKMSGLQENSYFKSSQNIYPSILDECTHAHSSTFNAIVEVYVKKKKEEEAYRINLPPRISFYNNLGEGEKCGQSH